MDKISPDIQPEQIMEGLKDKDLYAEIAQTQTSSKESNSNIIRRILGISAALNPIINYVNGNYEKQTALDLFSKEVRSRLRRFQGIRNFIERLFVDIANILKSTGKTQEQTSEKVEKVMAEDPEVTLPEPIELKVGQSIDLEKDKPVLIAGARNLIITILRDEDKKDHKLKISRRADRLKTTLSCLTSDSDDGKKMTFDVERGDEFVIGMVNLVFIKRLEKKLKKAQEQYAEAKQRHTRYSQISKISEDTLKAKEQKDKAKAEIDDLKGTIEMLKNTPQYQWFDREESSDISQDHIIIRCMDDGPIMVIDEGEECTATLKRTT